MTAPSSTLETPDRTKRSVVGRIIDQFVADLNSGKFRKGQCLPPEHEMAKDLGVSRGSLREAFRVMSYLGVIDIRRGDGTYVTELDGTRLLGATDMLSMLASGQTALEALELRRVLESEAARVAAQRITNQQLAALRDQLAKVDAASTIEERVDADRHFHDLIVAVTGNAIMRAMCRNLSLQTFRLWTARARTHGMAEIGRNEHWMIYKYLEAHEPELAASAASLHVAGIRDWAKTALASTLNDSTTVETDTP